MVGAALFASGLFTICTLGYNLFTGKACYLPGSEQKGKYLLWLLQIWVGNLIGAAATGYLIRLTRAGSALAEKAQGLCETKLSDSLLSIFILAVFCNLMIYIAVENFKSNPHTLGKYLAIFLGVMVFILAGFEHCVANMLYFSGGQSVEPAHRALPAGHDSWQHGGRADSGDGEKSFPHHKNKRDTKGPAIKRSRGLFVYAKESGNGCFASLKACIS